jgi:hypothetical protein
MGEMLDWLKQREVWKNTQIEKHRVSHPDGYLVIAPGSAPGSGLPNAVEPSLICVARTRSEAEDAANGYGRLCWIVSVASGTQEERWMER